jgi:hypothetical protein
MSLNGNLNDSSSYNSPINDQISASLVLNSVECDGEVKEKAGDGNGIDDINKRFRLIREAGALSIRHAKVTDNCDARINLKYAPVDNIKSWIIDEASIQGCSGDEKIDDYMIDKSYVVVGAPISVTDQNDGGLRVEIFAPKSPVYRDGLGNVSELQFGCHTIALNFVKESGPLDDYKDTFFNFLGINRSESSAATAEAAPAESAK